VIGSFLMGFLFVLTLERATIDPYLRIGILTGVLGGFTTFSTYAASVEVSCARSTGGTEATDTTPR
jgi:fluoride ion exporter CrcB/FEX